MKQLLFQIVLLNVSSMNVRLSRASIWNLQFTNMIYFFLVDTECNFHIIRIIRGYLADKI